MVDSSSSSGSETKFSRVQTKQLLCIQYPGFIKNVDKMLETIGGEEKLSKTYYSTKCRLQLTYRPQDLNSHHVCGDLIPCTGVLMKVRRRKKPGADEYEFQQEIVGVVKERYEFKTLMDYQYLTPKPMWNYYKSLHGCELGQQNFPPYLAPPTFGRIDTCGSYNYRPDPLGISTQSLTGNITEDFRNNTDEGTGYARKRRQAESMAALFDIKTVPLAPTKNASVMLEKLKNSPDCCAVDKAKELFDARPIWSKLSVSCQLDVSNEHLKKIIQFYGFYWLSGPWRTMWCRMGYDPRNDPKAKIYQMLDFRVRDSKESKRSYKMLVPRRSYKNYIPRNLQSRNLSLGSSVLAVAEQPADDANIDKEPYIFSPNKMLSSRNMMFQLCDIHDEEVQKIIHENDGLETTCDEKEGWFPPGTMNRIRVAMAKTVNAYFEREKKKKKDSELTQKENEINFQVETSSGDTVSEIYNTVSGVDDTVSAIYDSVSGIDDSMSGIEQYQNYMMEEEESQYGFDEEEFEDYYDAE